MAILLHGSNPLHPIYGSWTFAEKAKKYKVKIPRIHLLVANRLTQYSGTAKTHVAKAYAAMSEGIAQQMFDLYLRYPDYFSQTSAIINSVTNFREVYSVYLRDFNSTGVVATHTGCPLSKMVLKSDVYGKDVQLDKGKIQECLNAIDDVITKL